MQTPDAFVLPKTPEILAPAGSFESVVAAVRCGADAVYLGAQQFSARASAQNFSLQELCDTVAYCHDRDVKVHLALNTALYDRELFEAAHLVEYAAQVGVDALIVSDLGVLSLAKEICPSLALHASTQLGIASPSGAQAAKELGFARAVLARELSRQEITEITKQDIIETEVFVHGALCMSVSGQCYLSSVLGGRSGNRGRCAQPCRLSYSVGNGKNEHALSLKDLSLCSHISEIAALGVDSFKIEGRMKRPEYVAAAVSLVKASLKGCEDNELFSLARDIFSRSGFTDGYYNSQINKTMFGFRSREDAERARDAMPRLHELYRRELQRVAVHAKIEICENKPIKLSLFDEQGNVATVQAEPMDGPGAQEQAVHRQLSRLGSTPYFLASLDAKIQNAAASPSLLNKLRRKAVSELSQKRSAPPKREINKPKPFPPVLRMQNGQKISARFENLEQMEACALLCDEIVFPVRKILTLISQNRLSCVCTKKITAELDRFAFSNDNFTKNALETLKQAGINRVCVQNIGQFVLCKNAGMQITWGPFMNTANSRTLQLLSSLSVDRAVASFELSQKNLFELVPHIQIGALVYGYLPLMMTRACPVKSLLDCKNCNAKINHLTDRKGAHMKLLCRTAVTEVYNCVPLCAEMENGFFDKTDFLFCFFTFESPQRCFEVLQDIKIHKSPSLPEGFTRGLYKTGAI